MSNFNNIKQYTAADIERYVNGQMPAAEMHALEKAALDDPFLADAIEGYGALEPAEGKLRADLEELQDRLRDKIGQRGKLVPLQRSAWWWVAAAMLILIGTGTLLFTLIPMSETRKPSIASNEVLIAPGSTNDSLSSSPSTSMVPQADKESKTLMDPPEPETRPDNDQAREKQSLEIQSAPAASPPDPLVAKSEETDQAARSLSSAARKDVDSISNEVTANKQKTLSYRFTGKVVDSTNKPVPFATVFIQQNYETGLSTDANGYFQFSLPQPLANIEVRAAGYKRANARLSAGLTDNQIKMQEDKEASSLNEVVVTTTAKRTVSKSSPVKSTNSAEPVLGLTHFQQYVEKNKKIPPSEQSVQGEAAVSFMVSEAGVLSDFRIEKPVSVLLDQEAIRLIKQGPAWKGVNGKKIKALVTIRF
ncbi:MAG: carboxypeptidase-like regulatory domain-containing protein [Chitinophagaceae bacterium]